MAEIVQAAPRDAARRRRASASCCGRASSTAATTTSSTSTRRAPDAAGASAAPSRSAGCGRPTSATTRPSASSPTGSTGSASRTRLVELGAVEGDAVLIGARTTPSSSTSSPGSTPAPRCSAAAARTSASTESRPAAQRRRAIDEAMPERGEGEARRRRGAGALDGPTSYEIGSADDPDRTRERPPGMTGHPRREQVACGAAGSWSRSGSSSLTTAAGGIDPARVRRLVDVLAAARSRGTRGRPGLLRRDRGRAGPARADAPAPRPRRPSRPRPSVGQGLLVAPLHRGVRGPRHRSPARCC